MNNLAIIKFAKFIVIHIGLSYSTIIYRCVVIYVYCYMTKVGILCIFGLHMHLPETGVIEIRTLPKS
jgi:hypothetical protein